jgi:hypothetical protein
MYFVSRQKYWGVEPEDCHTVEIASGGRDYANPDMLVPKFSGEGIEYVNPVEAVDAALVIAEQWKQILPPGTIINVAHGFTAGGTLPFEGDTPEQLKTWAKQAMEKLPKCDQCGEILGKEKYHLTDDPDAGTFCSEYCAEKCQCDNLIPEESE